MSVVEQIEKDLKEAMLSGDKKTAETLRVIKSAILYEAVNLNARDSGLSDEQSYKVLGREAKKRQEAADLYSKAGENERAAAETAEKTIIEKYLPEQLGEEEIARLVKEEVAKLDNPTAKDLGWVIGAVRDKSQGRADGGVIARLAKEALEA